MTLTTQPFDPAAKSMFDLITPKQIGLIKALARKRDVDPDEASREKFGIDVDSLSKRAASMLIDTLKDE